MFSPNPTASRFPANSPLPSSANRAAATLATPPHEANSPPPTPRAAAFAGTLTMPPDGGEPLGIPERKALLDLRSRLEECLVGGQLPRDNPSVRPHRRRTGRLAAMPMSCPLDLKGEALRKVSIWGVPLLPSLGHSATDAVLLKFLRARSLNPEAALLMLVRTLRWRGEFGADEIAGKDLGPPGSVDGRIGRVDRMGNLVCYHVYRGIGEEEEEDAERILRWRVQLMEKGIREMRLSDGKTTMLHVIDLEGVEKRGVKELQGLMGRVVAVLQDNYPEFVERNIFVNVSFRYYAHHVLFSRFLTQRTKSKFIFVRPSKVAETLLKFIAPENLPVQYGGLRRENDSEFPDGHGEVFEVSVKAGGHDTIQIKISEPGVTVLWDVTVVGWDVSYKEEFIPDDDCSYKVLIQTDKKLEENARNSFYINEPGKVVLTIENKSFRRKKAYYRWKSKPTFPVYDITK